MTVGFKARFNLNDTSEHLIYTAVEAGTINIRYTNRSGQKNAITSSISPNSSTTAGLEDYINFSTPINANGMVEDMGMVVSAGEKIFAKAGIAGVSIRIYGA